MPRCLGCCLLCFVVLVWSNGLCQASEAAAKDAKPAAKAAEPAAKDAKPAAKAASVPLAKPVPPAAKGAEAAAKGNAPAGTKDAKGAAASAATPAKPEVPAPPATHTVKKGPLRITVDLDGIFEAKTAREIIVKPEEWNMLVVESAAAHGEQVRKGDVILSLDTEKIDRAIADLRTELKLSEISVRLSEEQAKALDRITPLDLDASQRNARIAEEDRKYFFDVERPFSLRAIDFSLKMSEEMLEYEEEELRQLQKMYKADDITEETEQIVLKRARDSVERAKFRVEYVKLNRDQMLKLALPRADDMIKESAQRRSLDWEKVRVEVPLAVQRQRLELERLRVQRERTDDRLKKLLADREMMTVKAPIDGIVYYGKCMKGRFGDSAGIGESLRRNGSIMPNQVVMTIVKPRPMFIRTTVSEDQLHWLRPGLKGLATPVSYPKLKLPATIDDISDIPTGPGSFDSRLNVELGRKAKFLMPGMSCKVKLVAYMKKDSLTVPPKVVNIDELDEQKHFVYVLDKDGKSQRRDVTLGERTDKQVEIVKGLAEGEKVLLEAPKEQK
jgi:HlyD family secretion protein